MTLKSDNPDRSCRRCRAFTLVETVLAIGVLGVVCAGFCLGISLSFASIQVTREDMRATQILSQTMEVIRLCNWSQTNPASNFIPTSVTAPFYSSTSTTNGLTYQVSVTITNAAAITDSYSNDLRMVQVKVSWTSSNMQQHSRTAATYVSQYGMQNYVW
jgi:type II secretory pathway pseudopilin PulG